MFQFKLFSVDQNNCAMKINTDGVLLGALTKSENPNYILDIGTGTGVIALMLAQRFGKAVIDAVEIDELAAVTATNNFKKSIFNERLNAFPIGFDEFFRLYPDKKYDLIVSNPPFYINSLHSPREKKQLAKHADINLFQNMLSCVSRHLSNHGACWLVLPQQTAALVKTISRDVGLVIKKIILVKSFSEKEAHREIMELGFSKEHQADEQFVIYKSKGVYTDQYSNALKDFFTIF